MDITVVRFGKKNGITILARENFCPDLSNGFGSIFFTKTSDIDSTKYWYMYNVAATI